MGLILVTFLMNKYTFYFEPLCQNKDNFEYAQRFAGVFRTER